MNLYDNDLKFDPDKAGAELRGVVGMNNDATARRELATIQTAALIDIADSLRTLAIESALAMGKAGVFDALDTTYETAGDGSAPIDSVAILNAEEGTRVRLPNGSGPIGKLTGNTGVSEGAAWAEVEVDLGDTNMTRRYWASDLDIVPTIDLNASPFRSPDPHVDDEPIGEPPVAADADDLDADFDGDNHSAASDAVAALKARRKAAKKGKAK